MLPRFTLLAAALLTALRYDAEAGYVVVELESGEELWVSADWEGYHVFATRILPDVGNAARRFRLRGSPDGGW